MNTLFMPIYPTSCIDPETVSTVHCDFCAALHLTWALVLQYARQGTIPVMHCIGVVIESKVTFVARCNVTLATLSRKWLLHCSALMLQGAKWLSRCNVQQQQLHAAQLQDLDWSVILLLALTLMHHLLSFGAYCCKHNLYMILTANHFFAFFTEHHNFITVTLNRYYNINAGSSSHNSTKLT